MTSRDANIKAFFFSPRRLFNVERREIFLVGASMMNGGELIAT